MKSTKRRSKTSLLPITVCLDPRFDSIGVQEYWDDGQQQSLSLRQTRNAERYHLIALGWL